MTKNENLDKKMNLTFCKIHLYSRIVVGRSDYMNNKEYAQYLKKAILDFCGKNYLKKADKISSSMITPINRYGYDEFNNTSLFRVQCGRDYYMLAIQVDEGVLYEARCRCATCERNGMCEHIAACLIHYGDQLLPKPPTKEEISEDILTSFQAATVKNKSEGIKECMQLIVELDFSYRYFFKLHIGLNKTYVLNTESKFRKFLTAYKEGRPHIFGQKFTYNPELHYFSKEDEEIFLYLTDLNFDYDIMALNDRDVSFLLQKLKGRKFILTNYGEISNVEEGLPDTIVLNKDGELFNVKVNALKDFFIPNKENYKFIAYKGTLYVLNADESKFIEALLERHIDELVFAEDKLELFKNGLLKKIKNRITVAPDVDDIVIAMKPLPSIYIDFSGNKIVASVKFDYRGNKIDYFDQNVNIVRDENTESEVIGDLANERFTIEKNSLRLQDIDDIGEFLDTGMARLAEKYQIYTSKKIDNTVLEKNKHVTSTFSIGQNGILSYSFDTGDIKEEDLAGIFNSIKAKKKYYKLKSGDLIKLNENEELNELGNILDDLNVKVSDFENGTVEIPKYRAFYIDSLKENKYGIISTDHSFDSFIETFKKYKNLSIEFDDFDANTLREYQKEGVKWLYTIYKCDLGGILADEMGLGKSIQTISFIKQVLKNKPNAKIMIVCPTALIYNWKKEFEKFGASISYITVAENKKRRKEIISDFEKYSVFITSYGLIRNDGDEYEDKDFEVCIIDEAQAIKNYQAGMTKEIKKIKARTKIALTGTPIENSIFELWSIFDFIMPGYLNNITGFRENYGIKDVDSESLERLQKLNYQIKPFILRRKKNEVSKDLPEKIENNIYLELPDMQKKLYMQVVKETQDEIDELLGTSGYAKARFKILTLLTKLRQICINPHIVYDEYKGEAIKLEKLTEIVHDLVADGHKILIFSSFKTVIDSVKVIFDREGISNYVIAGDVKSKTRMELVEKFNTDDTNCFLITLKSGGTGLNLTSADTVIHLDIWWNPQVENQATDRAHRIGQTKNVTVIKLITKGTIEEKIIELQDKKRILSENLIEGKNDSKTISDLSESEMKELLACGQEDL